MTKEELTIAADVAEMINEEAEKHGIKASWIYGLFSGTCLDRDINQKKLSTKLRYKIIAELKEMGYSNTLIGKAFGITPRSVLMSARSHRIQNENEVSIH